MKYRFEYESENAEQDFATIMDILLTAAERGVKIYKDAKSTDNEAETLKAFTNLNQGVADLGSKLDDFREVIDNKPVKEKEKK